MALDFGAIALVVHFFVDYIDFHGIFLSGYSPEKIK